MRDIQALVRHHPRRREQTCTSWALEIVLQLYSGSKGRCRPLSGKSNPRALSPEVLQELRRNNIDGRLENYGGDWSRFENALGAGKMAVGGCHPILSVPNAVVIDWERGGMHVSARTFFVSYEGTSPVFVSRDPNSREILELSLMQMRLLCRAWRAWPAVLPSMLLNVLWHWPLRK